MLKMTLFAVAFALPAAAYAAPAAQPSTMSAMPGMPAKSEAKKECCCDKMKADAAKAAAGQPAK